MAALKVSIGLVVAMVWSAALNATFWVTPVQGGGAAATIPERLGVWEPSPPAAPRFLARAKPQTSPTLRLGTTTLRHHDRIWCLAVSPDGKIAASTSCNRNGATPQPVRLWDLAAGKEIAQLECAVGPNTLVFSADGNTLASLERGPGQESENIVRLWDVATHKQLYRLTGGTAVAFSPDGKLIAISSWLDGALLLLDGKNLKPLHKLPGGKAVAFSADGKLLTSCTKNATLHVWELSGLQEIKQWRLPDSGVWPSLAFAGDGKTLAGDVTIDVCFWDIRTGNEKWRKRVFGGPTWLLFSPDGKEIVAPLGNRTISWWEVATGKELRNIRGELLATTYRSFAATKQEDSSIMWSMAA